MADDEAGNAQNPKSDAARMEEAAKVEAERAKRLRLAREAKPEAKTEDDEETLPTPPGALNESDKAEPPALAQSPEQVKDPPKPEAESDVEILPPPLKMSKPAGVVAQPSTSESEAPAAAPKETDAAPGETDAAPEGTENADNAEKPPPKAVSSNKEANERAKHRLATGLTFALFGLLFVGCILGLYYVIFYDANPADPAAPPAVTPPVASSANEMPSTPIARTRAAEERVEQRVAELEATMTASAKSNGQDDVPTITASSREPSLSVMGAPLEPAPSGTANNNIAQAPSTSSGTSTPPPAQRTPPREDLREAVSAFLQDVFIGGVRSSETSSRAVINGVQYEPGDIVNEALGLRFIGAREGVLYFRDANEIAYSKRF